MISEDQERLEACTVEILYRSNLEGLDSLEGIEHTVRLQRLDEVSPRGPFFR